MLQFNPERPTFIGVVHLPPLPGTPYWDADTWPHSIEDVKQQTRDLIDGGMGGVLLQSNDRVYPVGDEADPGRVVALAMYAQAVAAIRPKGFLLGVQLLRNGVTASLAIARLTGSDYIRAGALVGATLTTHGLVQPETVSIMAQRKAIDATRIHIVADISSSHYSWLGKEVSLADLARKASLVGAQSVVIDPVGNRERQLQIEEITGAVPETPVVLGGHLSPGNIASAVGAGGGFVRSCILGPDGRVSRRRIRVFVEAVANAQ